MRLYREPGVSRREPLIERAASRSAPARRGAAMGDAAAPLALAAPTAARSSRLAEKLYLPSALLSLHMPSGLADVRTVPRLQEPDEEHDAAERHAGRVRRRDQGDGARLRHVPAQEGDLDRVRPVP